MIVSQPSSARSTASSTRDLVDLAGEGIGHSSELQSIALRLHQNVPSIIRVTAGAFGFAADISGRKHNAIVLLELAREEPK
jgi:hypothetical protein